MVKSNSQNEMREKSEGGATAPRCALKVAAEYGIALTPEGQCYRAACPVCGRAHMVFSPSLPKHGGGYYFGSPCYDGDGHSTGSGLNLDFWLRKKLGWKPSGGAVTQAQPIQPAPAPKPIDAGLLAKIVHGAAPRLTPESAGGQYLKSRHITRATARAWRLGWGFWGVYENHAVVIPWYSPDHRLAAVSYRLIQPTDDQPKYAWHAGLAGQAIGLLCGWHSHQARKTLIVVEGTINALSIYQAIGDLADVLTPGSENTNPSTWVGLDRFGAWSRVIVWADKPATAQRWGAALGTSERIISTPGEVKTDANDLLRLRRGALREFLAQGMGETA